MSMNSGAVEHVGTAGAATAPAPANLGDILERVLDKGLVVAGDIRVNLLDIELLTVKLRLVIASLETAREVGIDWWEHDPWLRGGDGERGGENRGELGERDERGRELENENRRLRRHVAELEAGGGGSEDSARRRRKEARDD